MTKHVWGIIAPAWYVEDQFPQRMKSAIGPNWTMKDIVVDCLEFLDSDKKPLKMAQHISRKTVNCGYVYGLIVRAKNEAVPFVGLAVDVNIEDS